MKAIDIESTSLFQCVLFCKGLIVYVSELYTTNGDRRDNVVKQVSSIDFCVLIFGMHSDKQKCYI